jgi:sterol desaturase/sphingolipid hydroxylase (fatty acid hydroxylase superfamily)
VKEKKRWQAERQIPSWLSFTLTAGAFGALLWLERRRPLRPATEPALNRDVRNVSIAAGSALVTNLIERPLALKLARRVVQRQQGLLQQVRLPDWLEALAACVLMDYTLYGWHYLTHKVGFLWRIHVVHHADLDLSTTTAFRFHFAEMLLSVPFRLAQVRCLGVAPFGLSLWQTLLFLSVMFHHSNVKLPKEWERRLNWFLVTPRMHGIHHSNVRTETDANWSSGLTLWDWLHGTLNLDVPQSQITIGVPAYSLESQVTFGKMIALPFTHQPDSWQLPERENPLPPRSDID